MIRYSKWCAKFLYLVRDSQSLYENIGFSNQSVFWNISIFDKFYFEQIFGEFLFPDDTKSDYESLFKLQQFFLEWFRKERQEELLTYPVLTAAILVDENGKPKDEKFIDVITSEMEKGLSFFIYESNSADSLASCCFDKSQKVLVRNEDGVKLINIGDYKPTKNLTVFFNGSWVKSSYVSISCKNQSGMYEITTSNNKTIKCTGNHFFPVIDNNSFINKRAEDLTENDYLMFNNRAYDEGPGTYAEGMLIGLYLGGGSRYKRNNCDSVETTLSLSIPKIKKCREYLREWNLCSGSNHVKFAKTTDRNIYDFIGKWVKGEHANEKELNMDVCNMSLEFRKGILDGYYITDGGNSNRIYTTSSKLTEQIEAMLNTMGIQTIINVSDRTDGPVVIRGEEYKRNFPIYCIRWYEPKNKRAMGDIYKINMCGTFFKIKNIKKIEEPKTVYCFNIDSDKEPYFTLANGVNVHNCRLRNELADNTFSYTLGAGGVSTGSFRVITINMNRYVQQYESELPFKNLVQRLHMYLAAHREVIKEYIKYNMLPAYTAQFINVNTQFGTIGINGMLEAMEYKGLNPEDDMDKYLDEVSSYLKILYETNKDERKKYGFRFNTEFVPKMCGDLTA